MSSSHRNSILTVLFIISMTLAIAPLAQGQTAGEIIKWSELPPIPDDNGFNGSFIGVHSNALIVAGGANFPNTPVWEGGAKYWYDNIYILEDVENPQWHSDQNLKLPRPLGYGVSINTDDGILCIGGNNSEGSYSEVFLLKWNSENKELIFDEFPPLPVSLAAMSGDKIGNSIYVAGGQESSAGPATRHFFTLDLSKKNSADFQWEELEPWPGPARINPVVVAQNSGQLDALYLFSGRDFQPDSNLPHKFHSDVYMYNPKSEEWTQKSDIPSNQTPGIEGGFIGAAPAIKHGGSHILIFGGAGGENQQLMKRMELQSEIDKLQTNKNADSMETTAAINTIEEPNLTTGSKHLIFKYYLGISYYYRHLG